MSKDKQKVIDRIIAVMDANLRQMNVVDAIEVYETISVNASDMADALREQYEIDQ